jgi:4-amino-4-deoxy-L-arabinose transferase-like glycosyltransferase
LNWRQAGERKWVRVAALAALGWLAAWAVQRSVGAYEAELSGYPDEPGHFISSLMIRQYALGGWRADHPVRFAEQYYLHYPKVAIGHWPPFLYILQSAWMLLFPASIPAVLWLQALFLGLLAALVAHKCAGECGWLSAAAFALMMLLLPESQRLGSQVMSEPLLALETMLVVITLTRFFASRRWIWLAAYGLVVVCAVYTKGSGLALLPVAGAVALLKRDWAALRNWRFWAVHALTVALYAPWHLLTWRMVSNGMVTHPDGAFFLWPQLIGFLQTLPLMAGWPMVIAAVLGAALSLIYRRRETCWLIAAITFLMVFSFHCVSPSGVELRRLYMGLPLIVLLAAVGVSEVLARWGQGRWAGLAAAALAALSLFQVWTPVRKIESGGRAVACWMHAEFQGQRQAVLLASHYQTEGVLIAEFGQLRPDPAYYVLRGSKILADSDWNGQDYRLRATNTRAVEELLDQVPVRFVALDEYPGSPAPPHCRLVEQLMRERAGKWKPVREFPMRSGLPVIPGKLRVYERQDGSSFEVRLVKVDLGRMLNRWVGE